MIIFLNKLPIPNLKHYCLFSFGLLGIVLLYSQKLFYEIKNNNYTNEKFNSSDSAEQFGLLYTTYKAILHETWCVWTLINFCYCCILLFSKVLQGIIFGKLRAIENQHIKDHFWNFIFLKFIFIFGVLNLENVNEVVLWCTWFSVIGFLAIHCQICKDRFEYLSFSTTTPLKSHIKVFLLLLFIQILCFSLIVASFITQKEIGISMSLFMFAEAFGLTLRTLYVITRYTVHLCDIYCLAQWNNKGTIVYYIDFLFETSVVTIDLLHYLHMLIYGNFYLSMASLVICMELKRLFFDLKRRMKRHSNYLKVIEKMEKRFPWASSEELENSDKCAVCWEKLDNARRLPCLHIFHHNCLRSWLEQDTSCPTCRKSLQDEKENQSNRNNNSNNTLYNNEILSNNDGTNNNNNNNTTATNNNNNNNNAQNIQQQPQLYQRNLFHFDGSRYISWLPSFSLQVTNGANIILPSFLGNRTNIDPERLNEMTQQISQMFPHLPLNSIQNDLRQTNSVELTIENILQDRLSTANNNVRNNNSLLNLNEFLAEDDDEDDEDDEDEMSSSDDDLNNHNNNTSNLNTNENALRRRTNNSIFSNFLGGSSTNTMNNNSNNNNNNVQANNNTINTNVSSLDQNSYSQTTGGENSAILDKYTTSPRLSENANNLIERKRNLILETKKRFLEKSNKPSSLINENNIVNNNNNNLNLSNDASASSK